MAQKIQKRSQKYWQNRMDLLEQSSHDKGLAASFDIEKAYKQAEKEINNQIYQWFGRFIENNDLNNMSEAKKLLNSKELKELQWDVNEYIQHAEENELNGKWIKELENASAKHHISRLDALSYRYRNR